MTYQGKHVELKIDGKPVRLHYRKEGSGAKAMITFHGFGQTGEDMQPVAEAFVPEYTTYHVDIFFHGASYWHNEIEYLAKPEWIRVFSALLETENIDRFSIAAFSMGGKFALTTIEFLASRIDEVFLIAPDGIRTSPWYSLATYPMYVRRYFRSTIVKPERFLTIVRGARKLGLVDRGMERFVSNEMNTRKKRRRVYYSWIVFRELSFDLRKIGKLIRDNDIALTMITGKYDKIIRTEHMGRLTHLVPNSISIEIESGHNQLVSKAMNQIMQKKT